jgi:BirA family biotin operon repressor/biotin-[acetyl-CoA-carboxylase] ligase
MQLIDLSRLSESGLVQRLEFHQSLSSTNDRAANLASEEFLACPALVIAAEQTAGRGRGGNRWWSSGGGLMFSLVLAGKEAKAAPANWSGYSLTAGLAIAEALAEVCPAANFTVKWPNDVYANEHKICGILIESPAQARGRLIVGIGVNVNNSFRAAPPELISTATALCDLSGAPHDLTAVLFNVLTRLAARWHQLNETGFAAIRPEWQERSLLTGRTVTLQCGNTQHVGRCCGIDEEGNLVLQTERGRQSFAAGSVVHFE